MPNRAISWFSANRLVASLVGEFDAVLGSRPTKGRDPFEWMKSGLARRLYWDLLLSKRLPLALEFEMNSNCNRTCSYCPVSNEPRPKGDFDFNEYKKIVDELAAQGFRGLITPNTYGEPMLDKRIYDFTRYARSKLPLSTIIVNTNGDALNIEKAQRLLENGVSQIFISQHDAEPSKRIRVIEAFLRENPALRKKIYIKNRTADDQVLTSRGGMVEDERVMYMPRHGCYRSRRVVLTFDGSMIICCEDYDGEYVYGNVIEKGFTQVWKDSLAQRRSIFLGEYRKPICKVCVGLERESASISVDVPVQSAI